MSNEFRFMSRRSRGPNAKIQEPFVFGILGLINKLSYDRLFE